MEFRRKPDYADTAYREAVSRLRILMAESYTPIRRVYGTRPIRELDSAGEETDNQSMMSGGSRNSRLGRNYYSYNYNPITPRKYYYPPLKSNIGTLQHENIVEKPIPQETTKFESTTTAPPELMTFIERQEDYIEQLEKESRFCKDELSSLLTKVKEVISENEHLHEKQKSKLIKSVFDHVETETETETEIDLGDKNMHKSPKKSRKTRIIDGPSIVFESRISELEAQLTQSKIDLKKAQEDNDSLRKKLSEGSFIEGSSYENFKRQLDSCNREKEELLTKIKNLQSALSSLRNKENDTCDKVKRSLDVAEQAQYEKNSAELEIRRLKDELERQHMKLRDAIADQSRRISDERAAVERRYTQQIEQLTAEVGVQWETTNKLQLELDKQRRENADLRRECTQKQALIDELKKDMQNKIIMLQSDIGVTGAEKSALEQQISTLNIANERTERQYKQEIIRLQAEIQSLRQRLDRADADLIHSRRENIRLSEQVASLEKEINLNAALTDERSKSATPRSGEVMALPPPTPKRDDREKELTSMIQDLENKHAATVAELESMIHSQNQLMAKLSSECYALTRKLEAASYKHKEEIRELQTSLDRLNNRFSQAQYSTSNLKDDDHPPSGSKRSSPSSQASTTPPHAKSQGLRRSESRSSLKQRSRASSRQGSQEKLPLSTSPVPPTSPQLPKNEQQPTTSSGGQQYIKTANNSQHHKNPTDQQYTGQYQEPNKEQQVEQKHIESNRNQNGSNAQYATEKYDSNLQYISKPDQQYATDPTHQSNVDPNKQYTVDRNQTYITDPSQKYIKDPQQQYSTEPNSQYKEDPNQQYTADPTQQYISEPYQQYPKDPHQKYSGEPSQQYTNDPKQQYASNPTEPYNTGLSQQYMEDPSQQYIVDPNQPYTEDTNQQYTVDPNQQQYAEGQYQYDPNMQYDPNQQYESDPNKGYDPNQQYDPSQQYDPNQTFNTEPGQYTQNQDQYYAEQSDSYVDTNIPNRPKGPTDS